MISENTTRPKELCPCSICLGEKILPRTTVNSHCATYGVCRAKRCRDWREECHKFSPDGNRSPVRYYRLSVAAPPKPHVRGGLLLCQDDFEANLESSFDDVSFSASDLESDGYDLSDDGSISDDDDQMADSDPDDPMSADDIFRWFPILFLHNIVPVCCFSVLPCMRTPNCQSVMQSLFCQVAMV